MKVAGKRADKGRMVQCRRSTQSHILTMRCYTGMGVLPRMLCNKAAIGAVRFIRGNKQGASCIMLNGGVAATLLLTGETASQAF